MFVPQSWITDVLRDSDPSFTTTAAELDSSFVRVGFEIEGTPRTLPDIVGPLVLGRVESIEELEGFKKPIRYCLVDVGNDDGQRQEIVCGARNFAEGDLVVVSLPGTVLPGGFEIAERKTYGRMSRGMICSVAEVGIGADHTGILVLPEGSGEPGDDARSVLGMDDAVLEVNVTPDRGYAFSLRGLARDLAAGSNLTFVDPAERIGEPAGAATATTDAAGPVPGVTVEDTEGVTRFCLRTVSGIDPTARTPWWMARRLLLAGQRPVSPAVDVTNYVLLELGQPLHAFDAEALNGSLTVRRAHAGETLVTLDGTTRTLDPEDIVVADESGPLSLAGVMGGASSEVGDHTTTVVLEAATFAPVPIFRTGRRHKLSSESSKRFERGTDPAIPLIALERAATLLVEIAGGTASEEIVAYGEVPPREPIAMAASFPATIAGSEISEDTTRCRLEQVGCHVEEAPAEGTDRDAGERQLLVTPPTWRPDVSQRVDLVEEVLRLEGLEGITGVLPTAPAGMGLTRRQQQRRAVGRALAYGGYVEVLPNPFTDPTVFDAFGLEAEDPRRAVMTVLNPLESARGALATTLLPALIDAAVRNGARGRRDVSLFGIGQVTHPTETTGPVEVLDVSRRPSAEELDRLSASLPQQPVHVATILTGLREPAGPWGPGRATEVFDAVESARIVARAAGVELTVAAAQYAPFHPGRCAELSIEGPDGTRVVGHAGELHPTVCERLSLPVRSCAMELSLDALEAPEPLPAPRLSAFPPVLQDVALVVDESMASEDVRRAVEEGAGALCEEVRLFDIYRSESLGEGKKSLAFSLRFRAEDRTLTEDEATRARDTAVDLAAERCGAQQRT